MKTNRKEKKEGVARIETSQLHHQKTIPQSCCVFSQQGFAFLDAFSFFFLLFCNSAGSDWTAHSTLETERWSGDVDFRGNVIGSRIRGGLSDAPGKKKHHPRIVRNCRSLGLTSKFGSCIFDDVVSQLRGSVFHFYFYSLLGLVLCSDAKVH